jgi:hypothetical protein
VTPLGAPNARPAQPRHGEPPPLEDEFDQPEETPVRRRRGRRKARPLRAALLLLALYALGGMAPLVLRMGRRRFLWALLGLAHLAAWVGLFYTWPSLRGWISDGRLPLGPLLASLGAVTLGGTTAWTRALVLAGHDERFRPARLPAALRRPWLVGALGFPVPGLGLLAAGRPVRAALALWNAMAVGVAALVLRNSEMLWAWNAHSGGDGVPGALLESVFVASAGVAGLGGLLWVAGALDGGRLASLRGQEGASAHGDWVALALLASGAAFAVSFRPEALARDADCIAGAMRYEHYRWIPLCLEVGATKLDPARPEYAMHIADLYVDLGKRDASRALCERLHERWEVYAQMLLREEASSRRPLQSQPIAPPGQAAPQHVVAATDNE